MREITAILDQFLSKLNRGGLVALTTIMAFLLGFLDFLTGFEVAFSFFYLVPVGIATWYLGQREGYAMALLCSFVWAASNRLAGETYSHEIIRYWNTGVRLGMFFVVTEILGNLHISLMNEKALSRIDFLTGINNRREFYDRARQELLSSKRLGHPLTIAFMDLDSFKQVNDRLGHHAGDELLRAIAQTMLSTIRKTDVVARMGGDEFALLLQNVGQDGACHALKKIITVLVEKMKELNAPISFSMGAATLLAPMDSVDEAIRMADQLMYSAKALGKNEIVCRVVSVEALRPQQPPD